MTSEPAIDFRSDEVVVSPANSSELNEICEFLTPFMEQKLLLTRTIDELSVLIRHGFVARHRSAVVGFASVEVYSKKLAELQCLAVSSEFRRKGIGKILVQRCVERASEAGVLELMAISNSEELFRACGFDYSLPNQKRALFIEPNSSE